MIPLPSIPDRIKSRPTYQGIPIPFINIVTGSFTDFRTLDYLNVRLCAKFRLCAVCGQEIKGWIGFIGGEMSIGQRMFTDPGMHLECAYFATKACPFLNRTNRNYGQGLTKTEQSGDHKLINTNQVLPKRMGIYFAKKFQWGIGPNKEIIFQPDKKPSWIDWDAMPLTKST